MTCKDCIHCKACDMMYENIKRESVEGKEYPHGAEKCECFENKKENYNMKAYHVWVEEWDYDEYDAFVVVAKDEYSALEMVKVDGRFNKCQRDDIHIEEVDLMTEHVVLGSFNAG